jgi:hypothetical protein
VNEIVEAGLVARRGLLALGLAAAAGVRAEDRVNGFSCARLRPSTESQPGYGMSRNGSGCEGFYELDIAGPYLELVSLVCAGGKAPSAGQPVQLRTHASAARVVVRPLVQGIAYRADLALNAGAAQWRSEQMLQATGLRFRELGFLAIQAASAPDLLDVAPVVIGPQGATARCHALVRTSVRTEQVRWRALDANQESAPWQALDNGALDIWDIARVELPVPAAGTRRTVQVEARREGGARLPVLQFGIVGL